MTSEMAASESAPGGTLKLSFRSVLVLRTLPAVCMGGMPSAPMTDMQGLQFMFSIISAAPGVCGCIPSTTGRSSHTVSPSRSIRASDCALTSSVIGTCISGISTSPVSESSTLSRSILAILNDEGITPPPWPECMPSWETCTDRVPASRPRSASVTQTCS